MPADDTKTQAADPKPFKKGDVLGEVNGKPVVVGEHVDEDGKAIKQAEPKEVCDAEHHAELTKRHDVIAVIPARTGRNGKHFPEQRSKPGEVKMVSLRCSVAHRVLHGMSPDEVKALKAAAPEKAKDGDAFDHWALRHIEGKLDGVPEGVFATSENLEAFAQSAQVDKLRKSAIEALSPS